MNSPLLQSLVTSKKTMSEIEISENDALTREIQQRLLDIQLYPGKVDGLWGNLTEQAVNRFCKANYLNNDKTNLYGPTFAEKLIAAQGLGNLLPIWSGGNKWETVDAICNECDRQGLTLITQKAYLLATTEHETASTWDPLDEYGGANTRYAPYWGRGYVQLTWDFNYLKYEKILDIALVSQPDLAKRPDVALFVLVHGSKNGTFTGLCIEDFIGNGYKNYHQARKVINGLDRAGQIAAIAQEWEDWLKGR